MSRGNVGLSSPGSISAFLEVVDLMAGKIRLEGLVQWPIGFFWQWLELALRYVPVPDPAQMSIYSAWYKQTYPDQVKNILLMFVFF